MVVSFVSGNHDIELVFIVGLCAISVNTNML